MKNVIILNWKKEQLINYDLRFSKYKMLDMYPLLVIDHHVYGAISVNNLSIVMNFTEHVSFPEIDM